MNPIVIPFSGYRPPMPPGCVPMPSKFFRFRGTFRFNSSPPHPVPDVLVESPHGMVPIHRAKNLARHKFESLETKNEKLIMVSQHSEDGWIVVWVDKSHAATLLKDKLAEFRANMAHLKEHLSHDDLKSLEEEASHVVWWVNAQIEATKPRYAIEIVAKKLNRRPSTLIMWEKNKDFPTTINPLFMHCSFGCRCRHYTEEEIKALFMFRDRRNGFGKCDELEALPASVIP